MKKIPVLLVMLLIAALGAIYLYSFRYVDAPSPDSTKTRAVLGFAQLGAESEWRSASTMSIREAAEKFKIELMFENAQQKQENQIKALRSFIAHKVDAIAFTPIVETGWDNVLQEAKDENIPVILVDRHIKTDKEHLFTAFIGSNFLEQGRKAGEWLLKKFEGTSGPVRIVELRGTDDSSPTYGRYEGFREVLSASDARFYIVASRKGDFMRSKGREVMNEILSEYYAPDEGRNIEVLFAHNDDMAIGAIEAMREHGIAPGREIVIISVDAQRSAVEALKRGEINCIVECNPYVGEKLMQFVLMLQNGEDIPFESFSEESIYTEETPLEMLPVRPY